MTDEAAQEILRMIRECQSSPGHPADMGLYPPHSDMMGDCRECSIRRRLLENQFRDRTTGEYVGSKSNRGQ